MALVVKDRVKQTTTTTGTGSIVLNGNVDGFQTFAAALTNGDTTYYGIFVPSTNAFEVGLGTWTESTATLARTTVLESSNSGSAINITAQAEVFITQPAEKAVFQDSNGDVDLGGNKILFGNLYSTTGDLPSASTYHGMFAHVHGTGKAYYAHAGNWIELVNEDTSGNVSMGGNLTVTGDLTVNGTTTTVNTTNTVVTDSLIELANGTTGSPSNDAGIVIERGDSNNAFIGYDESADKFTVGTGSFTGASTGNLTITTGTLVANVEGNVTGDVTGNADTATTLATGRTISLTGDVTGTSASFDGSGNASIATTIAANSVALGTDTTGNYVQQGATSGNGLSGSVNSEGGTFTVTSNATNANTASTIVFRDASGDFSAGTITAALSGNASTATSAAALTTARDISLTGAVTGSTSFDGSGNVSITTTATSDPTLTLNGDVSGSATFTNLGNATLTVTVADDSHNHTIANVDGLQTALDGKLGSTAKAADSELLDGINSTSFLRSDTADSTASTISFTGDIEVGDQILHNGDTDTYMQYHAADSWRVVTGGVERLEATNSGVRIDDAYTLPTADGSSGQVLSTNGSGTLSFIDAGGGAWEETASGSLNSAFPAWTVATGYYYIFEFHNLFVGTNGSAININYSDNGGTNYSNRVTSGIMENDYNNASWANTYSQQTSNAVLTYYNAPGTGYPSNTGGMFIRLHYYQPSGKMANVHGFYLMPQTSNNNRQGIYRAMIASPNSNNNATNINRIRMYGNGSPTFTGNYRILRHT